MLFEALSRLDGDRPVVALAGDGPMRQEFCELAERLGLQKHVHFLGQRRDIPDLLHAADISVLPTLSDAFPLFVLESMAAGLPVIASNVDGVPEMVTDGENGLLIPLGDASALAEAISSLSKDSHRAKEMGISGYNRLIKDFDLDLRVEKELALYKKLILRDRHGSVEVLN
ncbi:MAG: glycosyltransferase [Syntrophobacteraceae bacterium]